MGAGGVVIPRQCYQSVLIVDQLKHACNITTCMNQLLVASTAIWGNMVLPWDTITEVLGAA